VLPQPLTPAGLLLGSGTNATLSAFQPTPLEARPRADRARLEASRAFRIGARNDAEWLWVWAGLCSTAAGNAHTFRCRLLVAAGRSLKRALRPAVPPWPEDLAAGAGARPAREAQTGEGRGAGPGRAGADPDVLHALRRQGAGGVHDRARHHVQDAALWHAHRPGARGGAAGPPALQPWYCYTIFFWYVWYVCCFLAAQRPGAAATRSHAQHGPTLCRSQTLP
jgi:hypothetical protein